MWFTALKISRRLCEPQSIERLSFADPVAVRTVFFTMAEAVEPAAKKQKTEAAGVATGGTCFNG